MMQELLKLSFEFDEEKLFQDTKYIQEDYWVSHPNTSAYEGKWEVCSLTSPSGDIKDIVACENIEYKETSLLKKTIYIKEVLDCFKTKIEAVRFMKLGAKSSIKEHTDKGSCIEDGFARIHIPITSNKNVEFILDGNKHQMNTASCYYMDAHKPHSVKNSGDEDRIHLLIDCHVNEWLEELFIKAGYKPKVHKYSSKSINDENIDEIIYSLKQLGTETSLQMAKELEEEKLK